MMINIKIKQENPERYVNPRFYYSYVDDGGKRHKKLCPKECVSFEEAEKYVRNFSVNLESPYLVRNIAKNMYIENGIHIQRLSYFGKNLCSSSIKQKRYFVELIISKFGNKRIFDIKPAEVEKFLIADKVHGNSWKNTYLETFGNIFQETEWLDKPCPKPVFHKFVRNSKKADILSINELDEFFNFSNWRNYDEWLLFRVIFYCGLRISEARALRPCQFLWKEKVVIINGFCKPNGQRTNYNKKGSNEDPKIRTVILPDELIVNVKKYIDLHKRKPNDFIFQYNDKPYRREFLESEFKKALIKSCIKIKNRKIVPHSLRFTYVTLMRRELDVEQVKKLVGHNSVKMTEYYTRFDVKNSIESIKKESFEAVNKLLNSKLHSVMC